MKIQRAADPPKKDEWQGGPCAIIGCSNRAEATLCAVALCRIHFYELAAKRLEEHRQSLRHIAAAEPRGIAMLKYLSEVISATTTLVVRSKVLDPQEHDRLRELSFSAMELYKCAQRSPRIALDMPIILYREAGVAGNRELANTVNVSKHGACVNTVAASAIGEKIWIQKPKSPLRALTTVAWVKRIGIAQFLMGVDLVEDRDFWELGSAPPATVQ
jgi:hypothetical protein